ncbi:hypothetical protein Tco_0790538 [Tanacetum coccineum]
MINQQPMLLNQLEDISHLFRESVTCHQMECLGTRVAQQKHGKAPTPMTTVNQSISSTQVLSGSDEILLAVIKSPSKKDQSYGKRLRCYLLGGTQGAVQQGPVVLESLNTFQLKKERCPVEDTMRLIKEDHFKRNNARGNGVAGNVGARECPRPKRLQDSDYFKDKMLLMQAQESGGVLDEEQSLFLQENRNVMQSTLIVDEGPTSQTMFMANLTYEDLIYDEAGPSYDSNNPFEVQDHDTFVDHMDEYHEVHKCKTIVQTQLRCITEGERGFEQTKRCYLTEVILFFKTLKEHFVGVQTALFKEVKEMEEIFDQMNNEVDKNTVDKQCAEIEKKNLLIENENLIVNCLSTQLLYDVEKSRCLDLEADMSKVHDESKLISKLEREYLNLQLKYQHLQESFDNKNSQASQEAPDFNSFFKIKNLEHQIQEKDNVIRNLKDLVANVNDRSCEPYNAKDVTALIEQNDCDRVELEKVKQHYKELYDSIKITRAHTSEKTSTMLNEIESLKAQLRSKEPCFTSDYVKPKVLAPGMYAIDVKPIPHPLKNNRSAHLNYISHLKESVETVREIVEEARVVKPLDNSLNYACQYTKLSQELLEYVIGTCPKSFNERDNKAPSTPVTRKKQVTFSDKPGTSSSNTQKHKVHQRVQQTNIPVIPSTGVNDSTEASGSKPRSNTKKNRILPAKKENKKEVEVRLRTNKSVWTKVNPKVNPVDSSISSKRVVINSNSESVCKTCNKRVNSASHGMCVVNILKSVNATPTVRIVLNNEKQIWKPKGKLSDNSLNKTKQIWKQRALTVRYQFVLTNALLDVYHANALSNFVSLQCDSSLLDCSFAEYDAEQNVQAQHPNKNR